jgi:hypothetical protein
MIKWKIGVAFVLILTIFNTASAAQIEEVGKYTASGGGRAIAVTEYAYMLGGDKLHIIDIYTHTPSRPIKVGECSVSGFDIAINGYAYVVGQDGMYVIDISNPYNPVIVGQCNISGSCITVSDNHAYIGSHWAYGQIPGLGVVDISDPYNPTEMGEYNNTICPTQIAASRDHIYVADGSINGLVIIDVSDPVNPQKIGQISETGYEGVAVSGMYAYLSGYGLYVVDVSDPSRPRIVGETTGLFFDQHEVAVGGTYAYVSNEEVGWGIFDISDPSNPRNIGCGGGGYALDVATAYNQGYGYGVGSEGLFIFEVIETGTITISSSHSGADVYIDGGYKHTMPAYEYSTGFDSIPVGYHTIKLTKSGYNNWETIISVNANEYVEVSATLTPQTGTINVFSVPAGAEIYLDGEYKGTTQKLILDISVGYHTLELNKEGYPSWSTSLYVTAGDTETISASMNAISIATPTTPTKSSIPISTPAFISTPTHISVLVDSDGDGVPNKYDYAPYNPNIQTERDIIPEATPTPKPPGFDVMLTISGILAIAYLLRRRR